VTGEARLLLDEMLSGEIAAQLRARGFDVVAVVDNAALVSMPDDDLLAHATADGRCLVTANIGDFALISAQLPAGGGGRHAGLIYIANRVFPHDRSFIGAVVGALTTLMASRQTPARGAETFLRRID
jgi:hypothetical protein